MYFGQLVFIVGALISLYFICVFSCIYIAHRHRHTHTHTLPWGELGDNIDVWQPEGCVSMGSNKMRLPLSSQHHHHYDHHRHLWHWSHDDDD